MPKVVILIDQPAAGWEMASELPGAQLARLIQQAMVDGPTQGFDIEVLPVSELEDLPPVAGGDLASDRWVDCLICPLTLTLPQGFSFPGKAVFDTCRDPDVLRSRVAEWNIPWGEGRYWLPIVLTAKGPLYAEVIGLAEIDGLGRSDAAIAPCQSTAQPTKFIQQDSSHQYIQPIHLNDVQRQDLYKLGRQLIQLIDAVPAVYLMQFGLDEQRIWFDRLIPFPDLPAIASLARQSPDLFICHWRCISHQAIVDLTIR